MMADGWGRIMTVVSDAGRTGDKYSAVYGAAKAGAAGLTRSVVREAGPYGVTANNIALGTMCTPMTERLWSEQSRRRHLRSGLVGERARRMDHRSDHPRQRRRFVRALILGDNDTAAGLS
jgi:NAD(P)-dependent dehydrogenase (short-subunit alcohol dehydrogenase family)